MTADLPKTRPGVRPVAFPPSPHIPDWRAVGSTTPTRPVERPRPDNGTLSEMGL